MKKILIVEDDAVTRQILHVALQKGGYETVIAADALTALTQAQKNRPDLIILDLGLPAGGGFTFLQRLQMFPLLAVTPVLVVSGQDPATHRQKAMEAGARGFLSKPVQPETVLAEVERLLAG